MCVKKFKHFFRSYYCGQFTFSNITPLVSGAQPVDNNNILATPFLQGSYDI